MENKRFLSYFELPDAPPSLSPDLRSLHQTLQSALVYIPIMLGFNAIGALIVYIASRIGLLDDSDPRILLVGGLSLLISLLHIPLFQTLRQGKLASITISIMLIDGIGAAMQIFIWQGIAWFPLLMAISPALIFVTQRGLPRTIRLLNLVFGLLLAAGILFADSVISYPRMPMASLSQMAEFAIYLIIIIMIVMLVVFDSQIKFKTIATRLVLTFTLLTTIAIVTTLVVAALATLFHDQQNMLRQLNTISNLKQSQIQATLTSLDNDTKIALEDPVIIQRMRFLMRGTNDSLLDKFNQSLVRISFADLLKKNQKYDEVLLLDVNGNVIISTVPENEKHNFSQISFFKQALEGRKYYIEKSFPRSRGTALLVLRPIISDSDGTILGILVARTQLEIINKLMTKTGTEKTLETYVVGQDARPITSTNSPTNIVQTVATARSLKGTHEIDETGAGIYPNYAKITVLGFYTWIPELQVALITEIERAEVIQGILAILLTNVVVGLFTISMAFATVFLAARSISKPIVNFAGKATALAGGELSTRIIVDRQDEIGTLASSFNTMAGEFQNLVRTLEQKVEDRTQDLQKQANRMRVAAEVARDATTARDMTELLNRSAQLVLDRFNFYHTGIFLIDSEREYVVLRASTTEAGRQLLANEYRQKIGQEGIVSHVAATGQPRIALNTDQDTTFLNNPLLPNTHSEMALPLKVENRVIGVLDVQSDEHEAFTQDDIAVLQIMADQLALAIERAQLVQELEESVKEVEATSQQFTVSSWRNLSQGKEFKPGYKYDGIKILALETFPPESQEVFRRGRSVLSTSANSSETKNAQLAVPLKLRDQIIGILDVRFNSPTVGADTISLIEESASRLAVSLENARLYTETQNLAQRERMVSEITDRIATSTNIESILRTTVQELGNMLPDAEVTVQIQESK
jgi:GAF domain-containing protein/HAMP domain-containing protein